MQQVTFQEYLNHRLSKNYQVENPYDQLEYVLTASDSPSYQARVAGIRFKASQHFFEAIEDYRESLEVSGMQFNDLVLRGKPIVSAKQIAERFYRKDTSLRFHNRLEKLKDWLLNKLKEAQNVERHEPWVQERIELLSDEEYNKAHAYLAKKRGFKRESIDDFEVDRKDLAKLIVQQRLKPLRKQVREFEFIDMKGIYKQLFADPLAIKRWMNGDTPEEWPAICEATLKMLDEDRLGYEDATPYLLLNELIKGFQANRTIKHIVVDEAQDYSPFQFEFLRRLFPAAKITVLGDFNQAIFAHASETADFNMLTNLFGSDEAEVIDMARSYRSTKPIIEFTRKLVPNGNQIIPFEREGDQPELKQVKNHAELHRCIASKVADYQDAGYNTIAIICKSAEESRNAFEALSAIDDIKLQRIGSMEYEQGVVVVPSYLAKGIEFDAVIIFDASEHVYGDESLRRIFYTACTRAMHNLQLYSVGDPTPLLQTVPRDFYLLD